MKKQNNVDVVSRLQLLEPHAYGSMLRFATQCRKVSSVGSGHAVRKMVYTLILPRATCVSVSVSVVDHFFRKKDILVDSIVSLSTARNDDISVSVELSR